MPSRIALLQGHPDPAGGHFCHALERAYAQGAKAAGHELRQFDLARIEFPLLRTRDQWESAPPPQGVQEVQEAIAWAGHLVLFFPLWLGTMPALVKAFLEQALRPGFAIGTSGLDRRWVRLLGGRSARLVVTMGMPAFVYRWYFGSHGLKGLERNVLRFCGIGPIRETLIGNVEGMRAARREQLLLTLRALGQAGR